MAPMQLRGEPIALPPDTRKVAPGVPDAKIRGCRCALKNGACGGLKIDVRQGIARVRRHVAPARSLC